MSSIAFFAFLRIGEITIRTDKDSRNILQFSQVLKSTNQQGDVTAIKITFHNFKHSYNRPPMSLVISRQQDRTVCPVQLLLAYLQIRGTFAGPLFLNEVNHWHWFFVTLVCRFGSIKAIYSFRIGAASLAAEQGLSDAQIQLMGRWKSNAFKKYIRINSFTTTIVGNLKITECKFV